jgi:glycosyltransferase involved in cell wall biosynthesis
MKILITNKYFYPKGGADHSMFRNAGLLESKGHEIAFFSMHHPQNVPTPYEKYFVSNVDYHARHSLAEAVKLARNIVFNNEANRKFEELVTAFRPDLIQSHSIYHQISPSIYAVANKHKVPIVQFLHDYKVTCPAYLLLTHNRICNDNCKNNRYFWCALNRCTENSFIKSLINTVEMYAHNVLFNYYGMVDLYISPSRFMTEKVLSMGFNPRSILTLPHFVETKGIIPSYSWKNRTIVYLGRLSREKGIQTLITAVKGLDVRLKVIGSGPVQNDLAHYVTANSMTNVTFIPHLNHDELFSQVRDCMFTVIPSEWYENCPNSVIESFLCGKPVIGAKIGGIPEMVIDNKTGLTFESGNPDNLREKIVALLSEPDRIVTLGKNARSFVETELETEKYYKIFIHHVNTILNK